MSKRYLKNTSDSKRFRFSVDVKHVNLKRNRTAFEWNIQSFFANTMLRHGNYWPYTWFKQNLVIQGARRGSQTTKNLGSRRTEIHEEEDKLAVAETFGSFDKCKRKKTFAKCFVYQRVCLLRTFGELFASTCETFCELFQDRFLSSQHIGTGLENHWCYLGES